MAHLLRTAHKTFMLVELCQCCNVQSTYLSVLHQPTLGFLASLSGLQAYSFPRYHFQTKGGPDLAVLIRLERPAGPQKRKMEPASVSGQSPTSLIGAKQFMLLQHLGLPRLSHVSGSRVLKSRLARGERCIYFYRMSERVGGIALVKDFVTPPPPVDSTSTARRSTPSGLPGTSRTTSARSCALDESSGC